MIVGPQNSQLSQSKMSDSAIRLSLSVQGLQRLEGANHESDFAFIVGDERYSCPFFVAEFLSPRVTSLRSQDITIDEFSIETDDPDHFFQSLLSIGFGREVCLSEKGVRFFRSVCGELWNYELFEKTLKRKEGEIDEDEMKARLEFLSGVDDVHCDLDVAVIASHFYQFSVSDFDHLSLSVVEAILSDSALIIQDEDSLFEIVSRLASEDLSYFALLAFVRFEFLPDDCMERAFEFISNSFDSLTFGIWSRLRTRLTLPVKPAWQKDRFFVPAIDSKIISSIPDIFSAFRWKKLGLLYRGSRDGFQASDFHGRCNGHPNTLTLISSTNDCIFGGYTPVAWTSRGGYAADPSLSSFLFTLKNPHNLPARIFKQKQAENAIDDHGSYGPRFGTGNADLYVCDKCQTSTSSYSILGSVYVNDTGIAGNQVLTGAQNFTVAEIEVFEVI
jgi:hypothetical protein